MDFVGFFDKDIGFTLREWKSNTLDKIQTDALEVEVNLATTRIGNKNSSLREEERKGGSWSISAKE